MKNIFITLFLFLPILALGQSIQRNSLTTNSDIVATGIVTNIVLSNTVAVAQLPAILGTNNWVVTNIAAGTGVAIGTNGVVTLTGDMLWPVDGSGNIGSIYLANRPGIINALYDVRAGRDLQAGSGLILGASSYATYLTQSGETNLVVLQGQQGGSEPLANLRLEWTFYPSNSITAAYVAEHMTNGGFAIGTISNVLMGAWMSNNVMNWKQIIP